MSHEHAEVLIVGAGPVGLSAAADAQKASKTVKFVSHANILARCAVIVLLSDRR